MDPDINLPSLPEMPAILYAVDMGSSCTTILWSSMYKRHPVFCSQSRWVNDLVFAQDAPLSCSRCLHSSCYCARQTGRHPHSGNSSFLHCSGMLCWSNLRHPGQVRCAQLNLAPGSQYHQLDQLLHRKGVGHSRRQMFIYSMVRARTSYSASRTRSLPLVPTSSCRIFPAV